MKRWHIVSLLVLPLLAGLPFGRVEGVRAQNSVLPIIAQEAIVRNLQGTWLCSVDGDQWFQHPVPFIDTDHKQWWCKTVVVISNSDRQNYQWELIGNGGGYEMRFYLNGQYIGAHFGYWTPFQFRLPSDVLQDGRNEIVILVKNQLDPENTLPLQGTPYEYRTVNGIFPSIYLVGRPVVAITHYQIQTAFSNGYRTVSLRLLFTAQSGNLQGAKSTTVSFAFALEDPQDSSVVAEYSTTFRIERNREEFLQIPLSIQNPKLWAPASPWLYKGRVVLRIHDRLIAQYEIPIGMTDVKMTKGGVLVNGQPWKWIGVDYVPQIVPDEQQLFELFQQDIQLLKTLGVTVVRFRHTVPDIRFVRLCEQYGIFVTADLPLAHAPSVVLAKEEMLTISKYIAQQVIDWYGASPVILGWGVGDALPEEEQAVQEFRQKLYQFIKERSQRPVYTSIWWITQSKFLPEGADFCLLFTAFQAVERSKEFMDFADRLQKPVIGYVGKIAQAQNYDGYKNPISEEAQAKYLKEWIEVFQKSTNLSGIHIWGFRDYHVVSPPCLVPPDSIIAIGLLDYKNTRRLSFEVVKALVNDEQPVLIYAGKSVTDQSFVFSIFSGFALLLIFIFLNRSLRFRENFLRAFSKSFNFYADIRDQRIIPTSHTVILLIALSLGAGTYEAALYYFFKHFLLFDWFVDLFFPQPSLKYLVVFALWNPVLLILVCAGGWFLSFLGIAVIARFLRFFIGKKIFLRDTINVTVWSALPLIFAAIVSLGIAAGLKAGLHSAVAVAFLIALTAWFALRVIKGFAVVFDLWPPYMYAIAAAVLIILFTLWSVIYELQWGLLTRFIYFIEML